MSVVRPSLAENATPDEYAEAMIRCQGYAPSCSDAQECHLEGWCFGRDGQGFKRALKAVKALVDAERDVFVRSWLKLAQDALEHHQFTGQKAIDALKLIAIHKTVRREYGLDEGGRDDKRTTAHAR